MPATIVQISDCHLFADTGRAGYAGINPFASLRAVLSRAATEQADLVVATGDISGDDSIDSYRHFLALIQQFLPHTPVYLIPGNHDKPAFMKEIFAGQVLTASEPLRLGNWLIHGLNSHFQGTLGKVSAEQLQQVQGHIENSGDCYHLLAVHHHPVPVDGWMDKHTFVNRQDLTRLVSLNPTIKAVIYGHVHLHQEHQREHCRYMSVPSSCWQWKNSADFAISDQLPGYRRIHLADNGELHSQIVRVAF